MDEKLLEELKKILKGDVATDEETLKHYSVCASILSIKPQVVVFPKTHEDIAELVKFVTRNKKKYPHLALTPRTAGTCMSGGSIGESIIVEFERYFNHTPTVHGKMATTEPGVMYRDFEKETFKHDLLYPPYPSSREICAMGGIIANNAGGEKSLEYGKAEDFVRSLKVILADGNEYTIKPETLERVKELSKKKDFLGEVYRKMYKLITDNYDEIMKAKPQVSKNSSGYFLWNVLDREKGIFDLTKLFVGAQGTLGIFTEADLELVPRRKHAEMMVIYLRDLSHLAEIVNVILPFKPESLETYDDHTLKLATQYFSSFKKKLGTHNVLETAWHFLPELAMKLTNRFPRLTLQAEFTDDSRHVINGKMKELYAKLKQYDLYIRIAPSKKAERKYWLIRRESFNLLRSRIADRYASPFIDDIVVKPEVLPEFMPKIDAILKKYPDLISTVAGHVGNGNFHIIPLIDLKNPEQQKQIPEVMNEVFDLVLEYGGSTSGEHNDGIIRTPYVEKQFGKKIYKLFKDTKEIFDPFNIFNPGKKVDGDLKYAMSHIRDSWVVAQSS